MTKKRKAKFRAAVELRDAAALMLKYPHLLETVGSQVFDGLASKVAAFDAARRGEPQ